MKAGLFLGLALGLATAAAHAAPPPYCSQPSADQKPGPVCGDARLRAIEADLAKAYEAARGRLAANPALMAALEHDETRFLAQRDAIVANLAKVDPYNRKEKEEFHDPASIMRKRAALLARIDAAPRKTLIGEWGGADGYLGVHPRENGVFVGLDAKRKQMGLDAVEDWLCRGMGEASVNPRPARTSLAVTIYRGDGEGLPSRKIDIRTKDGMAEVRFLAAGKLKSKDASPVCEGAGTVTPAQFFPLVAKR